MGPDTNGVEGLEVSTRAFFKAHCLRCHDSEKQKGKFRLDNLSTDFTNPLVAEKWSEVRFRINAGEMPPEEEKQPTADEIGGVVESVRDLPSAWPSVVRWSTIG
ncbi:MAG: c-type cytochrome domain-containing protein [Limisphaerales bacterium]